MSITIRLRITSSALLLSCCLSGTAESQSVYTPYSGHWTLREAYGDKDIVGAMHIRNDGSVSLVPSMFIEDPSLPDENKELEAFLFSYHGRVLISYQGESCLIDRPQYNASKITCAGYQNETLLSASTEAEFQSISDAYHMEQTND